MLIHDILNEDLGNLAKLNAGPMINLFKQSMYQNRRGDYLGRVESKFRGYDIGANSEILDLGVLKDPLKNIRKVFKDREDARGFAVYIGGRIAMLAKTDGHNLAGSSRANLVTYDLSPWKEAFDKAHEKQYRKPGVATRRSKEEYNFGRDEREYFTAHYEGDAISTGTLSDLLTLMKNISVENNAPLTAKVILSDVDRLEKMRSRAQVKNELAGIGKDLRTRLAIYKNAKRPSAATIEEFVRMSLERRASSIRFAGGTYRISSAGSITSSTISVDSLLKGKPFEAKYDSVDPGSYDNVSITYAFDRSSNQLIPVKAEWTDRESDNRSYKRVEAVLDPNLYVRTELGAKSYEKDEVIPKLLTLFKAKRYDRVLNFMDALVKLGYDWPEFNAIRKSIAAETKPAA